MKSYAILYALGRDRVGVADDLATTLAGRAIDIEQSRMIALGGHFALILKVRGEEKRLEALRRDVANLGVPLGFALRLESVEHGTLPARESRFRIECFSERPAEISEVTGLLKRLNINVDDLETESSSSSWSNAITFHLTARVTVPSSCSIDTLKTELRELERGRKLDVLIEPAQTRFKEPVPPA